MKINSHRQAFTLLEIILVLGIIALFLILLVPFVIRWRQGGNSADCVKNMQLIGKAIRTYTEEHEGQLPGPLSQDQYTVDAAGQPPRDGQLLKYIMRYLEQPANATGSARSAKTIFTFPAWENSNHATDAPVFLVNVQNVPAFSQSPWGEEGKPALKISQLAEWTRTIGEKVHPVDVSKTWALTEGDQVLAKLLGLNEKTVKWVERMPSNPVHSNHRNALYFDWHVETLVLSNTAERKLAQ
jgi:prepilin-type processing-associated H-X9-DG protein